MLSRVGFLCIVAALFKAPPAAAFEILPDVESGKIVERVEWVVPGRHARLILRNQIPNHWFLFGIRGAQGENATVEVVGQETVHDSFPWKDVQPVMADSADISDPQLYDEEGYKRLTGKYPWRRIEKAEFDGSKMMTLQIQLSGDAATIALKFPCPVSYVEKRFAELSPLAAANRVGIYEAGKSVEGRPLRIIAVPSLTGVNVARWKQKPTFLIYAAEHPTEHESSHVVMGALEWLLSSTMESQSFRNRFNVLLIPHLSPDDTVNSVFDRVLSGFMGSRSRWGTAPEAVAWAGFWNKYIEQGFLLDAVISLHNTAGSDSVNFFCPITQSTSEPSIERVLHEQIMRNLDEGILSVKKGRGVDVSLPMRLAGWHYSSFSASPAFYEVNGQDPKNRLTLTQVREVGAMLLKGMGAFAEEREVFARHRERQKNRWIESRSRRAYVLDTNPIPTSNVPDWVLFNRFW